MRRSITTPRPTQPGQPRPFAQPQPQSGPVSWEEELRRLLEGGTPAAPPPMRPPPAVITKAPRSIPPARPPLSRPAFAPPLRPVPVIISQAPVPVPFEARPRQLATFAESSQAYERASALGSTVAQHIESVPGQAVQLTMVVRNPTSPELLRAVSLFQNAPSARQAVIASNSLCPPHALGRP